MMFTTDLALKVDPSYAKISKHFHEQPGGVRGRVRQGLVQADAPRYGPVIALSRPAGSHRAAALAGPRAGRRS